MEEGSGTTWSTKASSAPRARIVGVHDPDPQSLIGQGLMGSTGKRRRRHDPSAAITDPHAIDGRSPAVRPVRGLGGNHSGEKRRGQPRGEKGSRASLLGHVGSS